MSTIETSCKAVLYITWALFSIRGNINQLLRQFPCTLRASLADVSYHAFKRSELVRLDTFAEASKSSGGKERWMFRNGTWMQILFTKQNSWTHAEGRIAVSYLKQTARDTESFTQWKITKRFLLTKARPVLVGTFDHSPFHPLLAELHDAKHISGRKHQKMDSN